MANGKNVIFFLTDQQHFRSIQANDCPEAQTPNMDRLASEGLNFQKHFVANPVCSPSRGAIWSGTFPSENGLYGNGCRLPLETRTIPQVFSEAGYATGHFGKMHLVPTMTHVEGHPRFGFDTMEIGEGDQYLLHDDYNMWLRQNAPTQLQAYYHQMGEKTHGKAYTANLPEEYSLSAWVTQRSINWMQQQERPFFLSMGYFDPHHAWNPVEPYASRLAYSAVSPPKFDPNDIPTKPSHYSHMKSLVGDPFDASSFIRAHHAMVAHIDDCLGRLITALDAAGQLENTVIVFSSDHGEFLGNHGMLYKGPYLVDDILRVPTMIWDGAGRNKQRGDVDALTASMDFFATLPALAGIQASTPHCRRMVDENLNLCPDGPRQHVISEWRMHPFTEGHTGDILSVRTANERYTRYANSGEEEYYRHDDDPYELRNLAAHSRTQADRNRLAAILDTDAPTIGNWPPPECPW